MLLSITYDNFKEWKGKTSIYYYYTPSIVAQSSYKYYDTVRGNTPIMLYIAHARYTHIMHDNVSI
jgi:hypothetical protein